MLQVPPPSSPIIVKLIEPPKSSGLTEVLLSALGLTGVITLLAVLLGAAVAGVLFWLHRR